MALPVPKEAGDFPASPIAAALPLHCNVADDVLYGNIRAAIERGHDLLHPCAPHDTPALIVGGGPSAEHDLDDIRARQQAGAVIFALNGAGLWLQSHGIVPDALIVLDARSHNSRFVVGLASEVMLLLASQCDWAVFEAGRAHPILLWHPSMNGESEIVESRPTVMIGGSTTVGMRALRIVHVLGFRETHLYGYDSSYSQTGGHVYPQPENDADVLREVEVGGRVFYAPAWMVRQADDFQILAAGLIAEGLSIHVHGDGLLPEIARQMGRDRPAHHACYDLSQAPASYDFVTWLARAEMERRARGATERLRVAFVNGPADGFRARADVQNIDEKRQLLDKVMRPALALFDAVEDDAAADGYLYHYWYRPMTDAARAGGAVPRCRSPIAAVMQMNCWLAGKGMTRPITITLRETRYSTVRNSDIDAWTEFARRRRAEGYDVVFVRDTAKADEPIGDFVTCPNAARDVWARLALYSRATCNMITANGPAELLQFSDYPFVEIKNSYDPAFWRRFGGIDAPNESLPWLGPHQVTTWEQDTVDNIENAWSQWVSVNNSFVSCKYHPSKEYPSNGD
ncbi:6-hydroxymethylpterin diphosphokinase MptE-like protein [Bradyrhizobium oligotrophicum S58]